MLAIAAMSLCATGVVAAQTQCKGNPKIVDACRTVHGRLSVYNGAWPFVIWVIGTNHNLAVVDMNPSPTDEIEALPDSVAKILQLPDVLQVFGDYEVCPLSKFEQGLAEYVCVESASRLVTQRRN
jgi:hypothetical protein